MRDSVKNLLLTFMLLLLAELTISCAFSNGDPKTVPSDKIDPNGPIKEARPDEIERNLLTRENVKIHFVESEIFNSYQLVVSWPTSVEIVRLILNDDESTRVVLHNEKSYSVVAVPKATYSVVLESFSGRGVKISTLVKEETAPYDEEVSGTLLLKDPMIRLGGNRLRFVRGAKIVAHSHPVRLEFKTIFFDERDTSDSILGAHIQTEGLGKTATPEQLDILKDGVQIKIKAKSIIGRMRVALIGLGGIDNRASNFGGDGGYPGQLVLDVEDKSKMSLDVGWRAGKPGNFGKPARNFEFKSLSIPTDVRQL